MDPLPPGSRAAGTYDRCLSNRTDLPHDHERTAGRGHRGVRHHWPKLLLSALVGLTVTVGVVLALLD